ncbi:MAG: multiheme c-type cytochrome [Elusimicrobiota bacterium]
MKHAILTLLAMAVATLFAATLSSQEKAGGAAYIGEKKCKMCHMKQHKAWAESLHSKNFSALIGDETKDPSCLKCHTTGFDKGGYDPAKSEEENAKFLNVQCESCHGPGGDHFKAPMAQKKDTITRTPLNCAECHNPHKSFGEEAKAKRKEKGGAGTP